MGDESSHTLTHFAPLASESKPTGNFFTRIFKRNVSEPANLARELKESTQNSRDNDTPSSGTERRESSVPREKLPVPSVGLLRSLSRESSRQDLMKSERSDDGGSSNEKLADLAGEVRTFSGVLKRLGNILEHRGQTPQAYRDSDFRQYWMPDAHCKQCYDCGDRFTTFRRRHHCRICGQIFCSRCCNQEVPGKIMGYTGYLRVCKYCCNIVLDFAQNVGMSGEDSPDIQENIREHLAVSDAAEALPSGLGPRESFSWASPVASRRRLPKLQHMTSAFEDDVRVVTIRSSSISELDLRPPQSAFNPFDVTPQSEYSTSAIIEQERKLLLQDSAELRELWQLIQCPKNGIELQSHRYRLRTYHNCLIGQELVDWLLAKDKAYSREQAKVIGQALLDAQWLTCITFSDQVFRDEYCLYRPGQAALRDEEEEVISPGDTQDTDDPQWIREIQGEDTDDKSDLNKIPSTLSPQVSHHNSSANRQSIFYLDPRSAAEIFDPAPCDASTGSPYLRTKQRTISSAASVNSDTQGRHLTTEQSSNINKRMSISSTNDFPVSLSGGLKRQDSVVAGLLSSVKPGASDSPSDRLDKNMEPQLGWLNSENRQNLREENGEKLAYDRLCKVQLEHMTALTRQLLNSAGLSMKWQEVVLYVTSKVSQMVQPDVNSGDSNDIRNYVLIKKIPGESRNHTQIISGVVCSKNTAHKKMRRVIQNPKILLLRAPIEYQRVENKFSSLEPQILQEREYLKNCIGRLAAVEPDIVLVEKTVSRLAQQFILDTNITLVTNVKPSVMERVARMTRAHVLNSVDGLTSRQCLGQCQTFRMHSYTLPDGKVKSLMYFDGCDSELGCTVTLRGAGRQELQKVKRILQQMTYVSYHLRLEFSYLMDAFALPPSHPDEQILSLAESPTGPDDHKLKNSETRLDSEERQYVDAQIEKLYRKPPLCLRSSDQLSRSTNSDDDKTLTSRPASEDTTISEDTDSKLSEPHSVFDEAEHPTPHGSPSKKLPRPVTLLEQAKSVTSSVKPLIAPIINVLDPAGSLMTQSIAARSEGKEIQGESNLEEKTKQCTDDKIDVPQNIKRVKHKQGLENESKQERTSVEVSDFSDPLNKYQVYKDESVFQAEPMQLLEEKRRSSQKFKKALSDIILSISPYVRHDVPYLETDFGSKCPLRAFVAQKLFHSPLFDEEKSSSSPRQKRSKNNIAEKEESSANTKMKDLHEFQTTQLTLPLTDQNVQKMLADFRARGGRLIPRHLTGFQPEQSPHSRSQDEKLEKKEDNVNNIKDCLDPMNHQKSSVLFSSFSYESVLTPGYCVNPWVVTMDFYGRNDITLGGFLERFCFRESYHCPNDLCVTPLVNHLRRFAHEKGCVSVVLKKLDQPFPNYQNKILMWSWCRKCKQVTPVIPMSDETWKLSFAKYLELRFHGVQYGRRASPGPCPHSIHHDHFQYFGYRHIVASFKYTSNVLREIVLPPMTIVIRHSAPDAKKLLDDNKMINFTGTSVFGAVMESILKLQTDSQYEPQLDLLEEYEKQVQKEKDIFRYKNEVSEQMISDLIKSESASREMQQNLLNVILDQEVETKRLIADTVTKWNERFEQLLMASRKLRSAPTANKPGRPSPQHNASDSVSTSSLLLAPSEGTINAELKSGLSENGASGTESGVVDKTVPEPVEKNDELKTDSSHFGSPPVQWYTPNDGEPGTCLANQTKQDNQVSNQLQANQIKVDLQGHGHSQSADNILKSGEHQVPGPPSPHFSKTDSSADLLHQGVERKETKSATGGVKQYISSLLYEAHPAQVHMPFTTKEHYLLPPCENVPVVIYDEEPSSIIAYSLSSCRYQTMLDEVREQNFEETPNQSQKRVQKGGLEKTDSVSEENKRSSSSKVLSFLKGNDIPRESSPRRSGKFDGSAVKYTPRLDKENIDDHGVDETDSLFSSAKEKITSESKPKEEDANLHIELQVHDPYARYFCRVYYADQFDKLRKLIFPDGEERYIRSLSRCFTWLARGGKSGSKFCKTQDDRLILKQMSRPEIQSFLEFAPHYFTYITDCHQQNKPTALAKILGVYRIGFRNSSTNDALKQDVLVMENLFYGRKISQIFDLKGSVRNRLVNTHGKLIEELVLLDENLLQLMVDNPLHVREHTKAVLTMAITNDTQFLSSHLVMDYSLLVGLDDSTKHLVVGIIDYIRTFTWDKKVETVVKSTILNSQGKLPTVLSPELYRSRFLEAMDRYFLMVPDRWYGLGNIVPTNS